MHHKPIRIGRKFGRLKVLAKLKKRSSGNVLYRCRCRCKAVVIVRGGNLRSRRTRSCGCLRQEVTARRGTIHGMTHARVYVVYRNMLHRCNIPNDRDYLRYGGRGIKVCKRWQGKGGFERFLADMSEPKTGETIERKNNNKGYSPSNCCWLPRKLQSRNKSDTIYVTVFGKKMALPEAAERYGLNTITVRNRYYRGDRGAVLVRPVGETSKK